MKSTVSRSPFGHITVGDKERPIGNLARVTFASNLTPPGVPAIIQVLGEQPKVTSFTVEQSSISVCFDVSGKLPYDQAVDEQIEEMFGAIERGARESLTPRLLDANPRPANHHPGYVNRPPQPLRFSHRH